MFFALITTITHYTNISIGRLDYFAKENQRHSVFAKLTRAPDLKHFCYTKLKLLNQRQKGAFQQLKMSLKLAPLFNNWMIVT